ncbi:tetratricopeptide repeat protein [Thiohalobacter thiocyanaticus]|uniref:tetratricopeptide repeat protein n=1 Tax=Thiohalobacter thiocyanaticus TaxID=585455 RepID=UPI000F62EDA1|nr:tetratricopeptide repeat protein [Thiohalobacter thiocyanaticus]
MERPSRRCRGLRLFVNSLLLLCLPVGAAEPDGIAGLLRNGDAEGAWEQARALAPARAGEPEFDMLYGLAAVRSGHPEHAVFAFERVVALEPRNHRARVELARAHYLAGNFTVARTEFERVLAIDPPQRVRENVRTFLDAIERREGSLSTRITGYLELRAGADSNVNSATSDDTLEIPALGTFTLNGASLDRSDEFVEKNAGLSVLHPFTRRHALFAELTYKDRENLETQAYDLRSVTLSAGPMVAFAGGRLRLPLNYQFLYLDNSKYRRLGSVGFDWSRDLDRNDQLQLFGQYGSLRYPDNAARNARLALGGAGWTHRFHQPDVQVSTSAYFGDEDTRDSIGEHNGKQYLGLRLGSQWRLAPHHTPYFSLAAQWSEHAATDPVFARTRRDDFAEARLGWAWTPADAWLWRVELAYTRNDSNISLYQYTRKQAFAGVTWRFE